MSPLAERVFNLRSDMTHAFEDAGHARRAGGQPQVRLPDREGEDRFRAGPFYI